MQAFDDVVNGVLGPSSTLAGVGAVFLSFFSSKIGPKVPEQYLTLLDNVIIKILIVSFLINRQIQKPSHSVLLGTCLTLGLTLLFRIVAPETPKVSELVKPAVVTESNAPKHDEPKTCNCYCNTTITGEQQKGRGEEMRNDQENQNQNQNHFQFRSQPVGFY